MEVPEESFHRSSFTFGPHFFLLLRLHHSLLQSIQRSFGSCVKLLLDDPTFFSFTKIGMVFCNRFQHSQRLHFWFSGIILFFFLMATAFMGYVLPFGQMSFWGATVITNLLSPFPSLIEWGSGGHYVCSSAWSYKSISLSIFSNYRIQKDITYISYFLVFEGCLFGSFLQVFFFFSKPNICLPFGITDY